MINRVLLLLIQDNLQDFAAVFLGAEALADNLNGEYEVGENGIVDSGECSGTRTLLRLRCARAVAALRTGKDTARS